MYKKAMVHTHNGILLSNLKNTFESVLTRWMKLEPIIHMEISQKENHQYSILTHIYVFRKMVMMTLHARQQKRHRCKEQSLDSVEEGEGGMIRENNIETCILSSELDLQSRFNV